LILLLSGETKLTGEASKEKYYFNKFIHADNDKLRKFNANIKECKIRPLSYVGMKRIVIFANLTSLKMLLCAFGA
jgi:hypothetical protein